MINLEDYKPLIDTTTLSDDEIELWYGSKFAVRFLRLIEGCDVIIDFDKYPNSIFYFKDSECLMEYHLENEWFCINYKNIWSILETEFGYNYEQIKDLTTGIVKQHFKCKVVTTFSYSDPHLDQVKQHFKNFNNGK